MGGYVASLALRAVGDTTQQPRPATFACHFLSVGAFDEVDLAVTTLRDGRAASSYRVEMTQGDRRILEATVWATRPDDVRLEHDDATPPDVPDAGGLASFEERLAIAGLDPEEAPGPTFPFWRNLEERPVSWSETWPPEGPVAPVWQQWHRFVPTATYDDPWVDACRSVILVDVQSWPAAHRPHAWREEPIYAPALDLSVAFHRDASGSEWLLSDGHCPVGADSLMGWNGRVWSEDLALVASGGGQIICRPVR